MNLTLLYYYGGVNSCNCEMLLFCHIFLLSDRLCKWNQLWRCCFLLFVYSPLVFSDFRLWFSFNKVTKLCNPLVFYAWLLSHFINWGSWIVLAVFEAADILLAFLHVIFIDICLLLLSLVFIFCPELNQFFTSQQKKWSIWIMHWYTVFDLRNVYFYKITVKEYHALKSS